jgi:site-specific DNA recombinase
MQIANPLQATPVETKQLSEVRYCLYARKSSEAEEKQALSVDSQIKEMLGLADKNNLKIDDVYRESHSAKDCGQRPVFNKLLDDIRIGKFDGILVWHPDRLARNAGDLGAIVDLLDQKKLVEIRTYSQKFTNNPNEKFLLMILGSQAKLENDNKSINVKRGLRARCAMGLWPGPAPTGYIKTKNVDDKCKVFIDTKRAPMIKKVFEKIAYEGWSGRKAYTWMHGEMNFKTQTGKKLSLGNFYRLMKTPFFYGEFEYPVTSGNWYKGVHTPIISKEVFQLTQEKLKIEHDFSYGSKEFAFTRIMKCGSCGSGISAQEKTKHQQNGNVHHYVYYSCNRSRDRQCREPYLREEELVEQICEVIDKLEISKLGIQKKMKDEIERFGKFQEISNGDNKEIKVKDIDVRNYLKYLLRNGSVLEKREVLGNIKSKIHLVNKNISF